MWVCKWGSVIGLVWLATSPAWAVNKCTGPDGKVAYQDAPCANTSQATTIKLPDSSNVSGAGWVFSRQKDEMDGRVVCFAASPTIYTGYRSGRSNLVYVNLQIAMSKAYPLLLTIRTSTASSDLFHNDIGGMGIKVDGNEFVRITEKFNANAVGFTDDVALNVVQQLTDGKTLKMRLRFWPYQQLHDTDPISLGNFKQAWASAHACLAKEL